jgi:Big-like domain-containing protein
MIRPWIGVLGVVALCAALPPAAGAQTADPDTTPPNVTIATPAQGATFVKGQVVAVSYSCTDEVAIADCVGTVANGANLDTSAIGPGSFTVTAHDTAGNPKTVTNTFSVVEQDPGDVGGSTQATLSLTLGSAGALGPFIPGTAKDYTATMAAKVLSTAGDATLTVADPGTVAPGHLVNGSYVLAQALKATAASANGVSSPLADIGTPAAPTPLETWNGPANDDVTVTFVQPIGSSDLLRTGGYAKTLTFTLSTTQP